MTWKTKQKKEKTHLQFFVASLYTGYNRDSQYNFSSLSALTKIRLWGYFLTDFFVSFSKGKPLVISDVSYKAELIVWAKKRFKACGYFIVCAY